VKVINQSHEILEMSKDILGSIERAGRTCYQSEAKIGCTLANESMPDICRTYSLVGPHCIDTRCPQHSSHQFVKMLRDRGHAAMLEFGEITVRFITNRGVTHELVRHRLFSFAQESTRYVKYNGDMEFIRPVWFTLLLSSTEERDAQALWVKSMGISEMHYGQLLRMGWRPEQAREVLPNSLKTEITVKGNVREFRHMLDLRCSKKAHLQMRALMVPLLEELKGRVPIVFDDI